LASKLKQVTPSPPRLQQANAHRDNLRHARLRRWDGIQFGFRLLEHAQFKVATNMQDAPFQFHNLKPSSAHRFGNATSRHNRRKHTKQKKGPNFL
jgi:hypothetical protein